MKTKALIIFAVTAKLICVFVFAYAKSQFSHDEAQIDNAICTIHAILTRQMVWRKLFCLDFCFISISTLKHSILFCILFYFYKINVLKIVE